MNNLNKELPKALTIEDLIEDDLEKSGLKLNFSSSKLNKKDDIYILNIVLRNW